MAHSKVYEDFKDEEYKIKDYIKIKLLSPGKFYIGYEVGGKHYKGRGTAMVTTGNWGKGYFISYCCY